MNRDDAVRALLAEWDRDGHGSLFVSMLGIGVLLYKAERISPKHHDALILALGISEQIANGIKIFADTAYGINRDLPSFAAAVASLDAASEHITDLDIESFLKREAA